MKQKKVGRRPLLGALLALGLAAELQGAITDNLVVHLTFDDTLANTIANGVDGSPVGSPPFDAGLLGKAVSLTSTAETLNYVTLGTPELLNFGALSDGSAVDFSVSFWCNYTTQSSDPVFIGRQDWNSSGNQGWGLYMQGGGNTRVVFSDGSTKTDFRPANVIRDGTWHHFLATLTRTGDFVIYIDGAFADSRTMATVLGSADNGSPINIGQDGTGFYSDGSMSNLLMDDLGIWRRALSPGEVAAIYNAGKDGKNIEQVPAIPNPFVKSTSPATGAANVAPNTKISAVITDGLTRLNPASVKFVVNGTELSANAVPAGADTTVTCTPPDLLPSGVTTVSLRFANDANPPVLFTNDWSFSCSYITLAAAAKVTPDTSKPGFLWRMFANSANTANDNDITEQALVGLLADGDGNLLPNLANPDVQGVANGTATVPNPANATIAFEIPTVINVSPTGGSTFGTFTPDDQMPGMPASDTLNDGLAVEIITYINLPAGLTIFGIASDDGFRTTTGWPLGVTAALAGEFNGGRGVAETLIMVVAPEAGSYAFRTTYENGTGDANIEWYTLKTDGTKVLLNDTANGGLAAYRATSTPLPPYLKYVSPPAVPRQLNLVSRKLTAILADGSTAVADDSVSLSLDGQAVSVAKNRAGGNLTVVYTPDKLEIPGEKRTGRLNFNDSGAGAHVTEWSFYNLKSVVLPEAKLTVNFDADAEGSAPTGWNAWNFTDCSGSFCETPDTTLDDLNSDAYRGWIVVSRERLNNLKSRIFQVAPGETLNGQSLTLDTLSSGNVLYAESDVRDGDQAQFIISKPLDLSAITNVVMSFSSLYEQNQDSLGAVEYSVDGGANWLPVVYFIDTKDGSGSDIKLNADGSVNAVRTLTDPNGDTATWTDNGVAKGGKYGDGIAAPITDALGPYVAARWNDNPSVDKRIEVFRLPLAGKKADVRLRFAQIGTASWYFCVDNIAFYEGPAPAVVEKPVMNAPVLSGNTVTISWTGSGTLQEAPAVTGPWTPAASQANPQVVNTDAPAKYYRISQ